MRLSWSSGKVRAEAGFGVNVRWRSSYEAKVDKDKVEDVVEVESDIGRSTSWSSWRLSSGRKWSWK